MYETHKRTKLNKYTVARYKRPDRSEKKSISQKKQQQKKDKLIE